MHLVFHRTHTYFLSSPILLFHTFRCSMCFLFHMFHFSVFHYFLGNCNCFSGDFMPFCSVFLSFCRISVDFISFLFYIVKAIVDRLTPFYYNAVITLLQFAFKKWRNHHASGNYTHTD